MSNLSLNAGHVVIAITVLFFAITSYAVLLSAVLPLTGVLVRLLLARVPRPYAKLRVANKVLDVLAQDTHYKYFAMLIVPTTAYFVIANWVGWQYYRNS